MSCDYKLTDLKSIPDCKPIRNDNEPSKLLMDETGRVEAYDKWGNFLFAGKGRVEEDGTVIVETIEHE